MRTRLVSGCCALVALLCVPLFAQERRTDSERAAAFVAEGEQALDRGAPFDSLAPLTAGKELASQMGDRQRMSRAYVGLALAYSRLSDWLSALDSATKAFDTDPNPDARARVRFLSIRGRVWWELRERNAAMHDYEEALQLARGTGDDALIAEVASALALMYWRDDRFNRDPSKSIALYEEALASARRIGDEKRQIAILNDFGSVYPYVDRWDIAERHYLEGLDIAARLGSGDSALLKNLGIVYREWNMAAATAWPSPGGRLALAERRLLEAVNAADRDGVWRNRWQARMELGTLYRLTDAAREERYFEECLDILEGQYSNVLLGEDYNTGALSGAYVDDDPYDLYIDHLLRRGDVAGAFLVAERARAHVFLDAISHLRDALAAQIPADDVRQERELLKAIAAIQARLRADGLTLVERQETERAAAAQEEQLTAWRARVASEHPGLVQARYPRVQAVSDIQRSLGSDEALLQYFLGAKGSVLWIVRRDGVTHAALPPRDQLEVSARRHLDALSTPGGSYAESAAALGRLLLPDAATTLGGLRRLIIVPHRSLQYLPFETLHDDRGRFLIESFAVSYAASAESLAVLRARTRRAPGDVIAVGNPVLRAAGGGEQPGLPVRGVNVLLPYARSELDVLGRTYPWARILELERATEPEFLRAAPDRAAIVHFATPGLFDEVVPPRSGLALTFGPGSDGILQISEIYGLNLNAGLVTLSASQSALDSDVTGEGMLGLTRAFFYAGADAVVASLWNVQGPSTAEFMRRFYETLGDGAPIDEALRAAKLSFLSDGGRLAHPYFWSAFVATGHATIPVPVGTSPSRLPLMAVVLAGAIASWWRLRRRARVPPTAAVG